MSTALLQYSQFPPGLMQEAQHGPTATKTPKNAFLVVRTLAFALCRRALSGCSSWKGEMGDRP